MENYQSSEPTFLGDRSSFWLLGLSGDREKGLVENSDLAGLLLELYWKRPLGLKVLLGLLPSG